MDAATRSELEELKYAYFRHLDLKEFEALGALLTEDAEAAYDLSLIHISEPTRPY